jgi:hypothetical protein
VNTVEPATATEDAVMALLARHGDANQVLKDDAALADIGFQFGIRIRIALGADIVRRFGAVQGPHVDDVRVRHGVHSNGGAT